MRTRLRDQKSLALAVLTATGLLLPVLTGGDHFDGFRFYQSVHPIFVLMLVNCARFILPLYLPGSNWMAAPTPAMTLACTTAAFAIVLAVQFVDWRQYDTGPLRNEFEIAAAGRQRGSEVSVIFDGMRSPPEIGTIAVGGFQ